MKKIDFFKRNIFLHQILNFFFQMVDLVQDFHQHPCLLHRCHHHRRNLDCLNLMVVLLHYQFHHHCHHRHHLYWNHQNNGCHYFHLRQMDECHLFHLENAEEAGLGQWVNCSQKVHFKSSGGQSGHHDEKRASEVLQQLQIH